MWSFAGSNSSGDAVLNAVGLTMIFGETNDGCRPLKSRDRIVWIVRIATVEQVVEGGLHGRAHAHAAGKSPKLGH